MRDFDAYAVEAINRKREQRATWEKFCERNDLTDYTYRTTTDKRRWSRKTYKLALSRMPKDHPDRWKYKIGARYADGSNADGPEEMWYITRLSLHWVLGALGSIFLFAVGVTEFPPAIFPVILYVGGWGYWFLDRYRKLSI